MPQSNLREDQIRAAITEVFNSTSMDLQREDELDQIDRATEAAERLIEMAGFDKDDSDHFGAVMGGAYGAAGPVHSLLAIAMMRCPQLALRILGEDEDTQIVTEETSPVEKFRQQLPALAESARIIMRESIEVEAARKELVLCPRCREMFDDQAALDAHGCFFKDGEH